MHFIMSTSKRVVRRVPSSRRSPASMVMAYRLAQLAGDAALLPIRIAPQRKLAAKARRDRSPLEGIVDGRLGLEEVAHRQEERRDELRQEDRPGQLSEPP
jgi:hypothetical protein